MSSQTERRRKGKGKAVGTSATPPAPPFVLPTYVPPPGALKSRAPGRQSIACQGCRRRKIKCDGSKPSCMSCMVIYKETCVYEARPTSADATALHKQLAEHQILLDRLVLASPEERERLLRQYSQEGAGSVDVSVPASKRPLSENEGALDAGQLPQSTEDDMAAAMLSELSVAASGQVEHFGVTSYLHRPSLGAHASPPAQVASPSTSNTSELKTRDVPPDLRNHLLDLFFAWQTDKPSSIPTAQGLLILGGRECACGNHSQGFLYTAMGLSMAVDLGVHVDRLRPSTGEQDELELEVRRRLFWSCYIWDKSISLCLGRSPRFLRGDRSFFNLPAIFDKSEDDMPWSPGIPNLQHYPALPFRTGAYFEQMSRLAEIIEAILLDLYASKRRSTRNAETLERFNHELEAWSNGLDADFLIAGDAAVSPPPNRMTLSMLYQAAMILVNRPFSFEGWGPPVQVEADVRKRSKQRCRSAVHEIVRLLELYNATFAFKNMNWLMTYCAYTAATISTVDLQSPDTSSLASRQIEVVLAALTSQSNVTPGVQRAIELVRHLMANPAPPSGTATPQAASSYKKARHDEPPCSENALGLLAEALAPWQAPFDHIDPYLHPDSQPGSLVLPAFPEAGPLAWPSGAGDGFEWFDSLNWFTENHSGS
ncbi:hypothetical protein JCM11251_002256 [Rhodosporidiobolus azoricus]